MIRAIFWKEWREHRWKYASFWLLLNSPILLVALALAISVTFRTPFADLSDSTVLKYLPLALFSESLLLPSIFLLAVGFLGVATFTPEIEDRSVFFLFENPVSRRHYVAWKLLNGAVHIVLAVVCALLLAPTIAYAAMLLSGKISLAGSAAAFGAVMAAAARGAVWCSLISLVCFTGSGLLSVALPRWWLATAASVFLVVLLRIAGDSFFDFFGASNAGSLSVGAAFGTAQWLTISRPMGPEVAAFAPWRLLPLVAAALLTLGFSLYTGFVYCKKELK